MPKDDAIATLQKFHLAQQDYLIKREAYRCAYAKEWLAADAKTADGRKYLADSVTGDLRLDRDRAEATAIVLWQKFLCERGPMDHAVMPNGKWGNE